MKRETVSAVLALLFTVPAYARSLKEIEKSKELRVCVSPMHASLLVAEPENCTTNCKFSGSVIDNTENFASRQGLKAKFVKVGWDEQFQNDKGVTERGKTYIPKMLASEKCDLYTSHLTKNEWRSKLLDFAILFPSRMTILVNKSQKGAYKKESDLVGKSAGVEKNTSFHTWLLDQNKGDFKDKPVKISEMSVDEAVKQIDAGKLDFTILDSDMALWTAKNQAKSAVAVMTVGAQDQIGWAVAKGNKELLEAVEKYFDEERKNPKSKLSQIWEKYYGMNFNDFMTLVTSSN